MMISSKNCLPFMCNNNLDNLESSRYEFEHEYYILNVLYLVLYIIGCECDASIWTMDKQRRQHFKTGAIFILIKTHILTIVGLEKKATFKISVHCIWIFVKIYIDRTRSCDMISYWLSIQIHDEIFFFLYKFTQSSTQYLLIAHDKPKQTQTHFEYFIFCVNEHTNMIESTNNIHIPISCVDTKMYREIFKFRSIKLELFKCTLSRVFSINMFKCLCLRLELFV